MGTTEMKRIAFITGDLRSYTGGEKYIIELCKRLKDLDIVVFSQRCDKNVHFSNKEIEKMLKAKIEYYDVFEIPVSKERIPLTKTGILLLLKLYKYDLVYFIDSSTPLIFMILLFLNLKAAKTKVIFGAHDPSILGVFRVVPQENTFVKKMLLKFYAPICKAILFKVPNIHVLTNDDKKRLEIYGYKGNIHLIPNFLYYKRSSIHILNNKRKFIVLFGGRPAIYHKGIDLLVDIINKVIDKNKEVLFHIFGSGEDGQELVENLAKRYPENVKYLGFVPNKNLEKEYKNSSLYIMTSRIEAFPLVILEAQAHGLPVIAFDIKGPRDIIRNFSGSIIKPFDTSAFSDEILRYYNLWKKGKLNVRYKKSIIDYIFSKYSDKVVIPKIEKMLTS